MKATSTSICLFYYTAPLLTSAVNSMKPKQPVHFMLTVLNTIARHGRSPYTDTK
jgi:hypothetical protein